MQGNKQGRTSMDKSNQIWYRFNKDQKQLKIDCVDVISKCYLMIGQKPDANQITIMASLFYDDIIRHYSRFTMDEIIFAMEKGIREGDEASCFINVRSWNIWLRNHKKSEQLKRQQNLITDYQKHNQNQKQISSTIKKAKSLNYEISK